MNITPILINVKDDVVPLLEDSIQLEQYQVNIIQKDAIKKTKQEWLNSKKGIKIPLTSQQEIAILSVKDQIIQLLSPSKNPKEILQQRRGFVFSQHVFERILERVERLSDEEIKALSTTKYQYPVHPETLEKIVESLINSREVKSFAEWKGYPYLNFSFVCTLGERVLEIVVNFELGILIVTLILKKDTGYFVREVYSIEDEQAIKKPSLYFK